MDDKTAMDLITLILSGVEWSADTAPAIAGIVLLTGRKIAEVSDPESFNQREEQP